MSRPLSHSRRHKSQGTPIEVLEFRTLLSVASSDPGPVPSVPAVAGNDTPIAHDDGPYFATHGKSISGSYPSVLFNDVGVSLNIVSGGLPATVSNTPGGSSVAYQVTDAFGGSAGASATIISTNQNPSDSPGPTRFAVLSLDPATVAPPPTYYMPGFGSPPPPGPLGGMMRTNQYDTMGSMFGFDGDGDSTTAVVATAPSYGTVTLTPYVTMPGVGTMGWYWNYNVSPGFFNVVDSFSFTVTDNVGGSTTTQAMQIAITNKPQWNWLQIDAKDDVTSWGSSWDTAVTGGSVMGNDYNPDGLAMTMTWGSTPAGFTGNADGTYSYLPPNIAAFMTGPDVTIPYTVIDANGTSDGAALIIKPKILKPGETAGGLGFSVSNGGGFTNGLANIKAYPDAGGLIIVPLGGPSLIVGASSSTPGGGTVTVNGSAGTLFLSATNLDIGPISGIGYYVGSTNQNMAAVSAGNIIVNASGNIASITATGHVLRAYATGSIGNITATGDIREVSVGTTLQVVNAGGRIGSLSAGDSINGNVTAGGSITSVSTARMTINGEVRAGGEHRQRQRRYELGPTRGRRGLHWPRLRTRQHQRHDHRRQRYLLGLHQRFDHSRGQSHGRHDLFRASRGQHLRQGHGGERHLESLGGRRPHRLDFQ